MHGSLSISLKKTGIETEPGCTTLLAMPVTLYITLALAGSCQSHPYTSIPVAGGAKDSRDEGVKQSASLLTSL